MIGAGLFGGMMAAGSINAAPQRAPQELHKIASAMREAGKPESAMRLNDVAGLSALTLPDGTNWFFSYEKESDFIEVSEFFTDEIVKSFEFTIYDQNLNKIGTIKDDVDYKDNEIRLVALEPVNTLTKKFFNYDDKYEFAVSMAYNSDVPGINHYYTRVYSIGGAKDSDGNDQVIYEIEDKLIGDMVNAAEDAWSENYYITFVENREFPENERYEDYGIVMTTYTKAGWEEGPTPVNEKVLIFNHMPGDQENTPYMMTWREGNRAYFLFSEYEKRFFVDPVAATDNDDLTPDNNLIIDIYSIGTGEKEMTPEKKVAIPTIQNNGEGVLATFYAVGTLGYLNDVIHNGNTWNFVLTKQRFSVESEETINSYYLVDENGNDLNPIYEEAETFVQFSELRGAPSQYLFATPYDEYSYKFTVVNFPSGEEVFSIFSDIEGYGLTISCARVMEGNECMYVFQTNTPDSDKDENIIDQIVWINSEGKVAKVDRINVGQDIVLAQPVLSSTLLSPYFFNTDSKREYLYMVKRLTDPTGSANQNEFMIINEDSNVILHLLPEGDRQLFNAVTLANESGNMLQVIYQDYWTYLYSCDFYQLPFDRFSAGGEGTEENPYLISSIGDFNEMRVDLSAHYRLANDFDAAGFEYLPADGDFSGTLDGAGFTISNLYVVGDAYMSGIFTRILEGGVKDINFSNATIETCEGADMAGLLAGNTVQATISNVQVDGLTAFGTPVNFGGLVGDAYLGTVIEGSSVRNADIEFDSSVIGGIVSGMRTGSIVKASSFNGSIKALSQVGGIAGTAVTGDETISDCHVNASLTANNTIGGIIALTGRNFVNNNYVEGEIMALRNPMGAVDNGPCAGGVAGEMNPNFTADDGIRISNNVVNLSKLESAEGQTEERYEGQHNTLHYIVGRSLENHAPDASGSAGVEPGLEKNYRVVAVMTDEIIENEDKTVDGGRMTTDQLTESTLADLGFNFGDSIDAPWIFDEEDNLCLFFEGIEVTAVESLPVKADTIRLIGGNLMAEGCVIEVYNLSGVKVATANDRLDTTSLGGGVYVAVATDADGHRSVAKFRR